MVAIVIPGAGEGQDVGGCGVEAGGGVSFAESARLFRERLADGREVGIDPETGFGLAAGFRCAATSRLSPSLVLEAEKLGDLGLYRALIGVDGLLLGAGSERAGRVVAWTVGLRAGWGAGEQVGTHLLIESIPVGGGPVLGAASRIEWPAVGRLGVQLTVGWRASWVTREGEIRDEEGRMVDGPTEVLHSFPLTGGLVFRL